MASISIINGHPDPSPGRFCAALCAAYCEGAREAGHTVAEVAVGALDLPYLTGQDEFETPPPPAIEAAQETVRGAQHIVLIYPLWLGTMPAKLKAFLEHLGRAHFLIGPTDGPGWPAKKMRGKSVHLVVTMGMPGLAYRAFFGAHSLKAMERGIFAIAGFRPIRHTIFGAVGDPKRRERMLARVRRDGLAAR